MPEYISVFLSPVRDNPVAQSALVGLLALMVLDFGFGVVNACLRGKYTSRKMREGLGHKMGELGYVVVGIIADGLIFAGLDIGVTGPVLIFTLGYLCVMEIGSLLEIFAELNPQLADSKLFQMLDKVRNAGEEGERS